MTAWILSTLLAFAAPVVQNPAPIPAPIPPVRIPSLAKNAKLGAAKTQLKLATISQGLTDSATLSVRAPYMPAKAGLTFAGFDFVGTATSDFGLASAAPSAGSSVYVDLKLNVAKPGKVHIATFYFLSWFAMDVDVFLSGTSTRTTSHVAVGSQSLIFAFVPTTVGDKNIIFAPKNRLTFYKVEIDVAE